MKQSKSCPRFAWDMWRPNRARNLPISARFHLISAFGS